MKNLSFTKYASALRSAHDAFEIISPSPRQLAGLCPHLRDDEIAQVLSGKVPVTLATPPLLVREAVHTVHFRPADSVREQPAALRVDGYDRSKQVHFRHEAQSFALRHWPGHLISKNWTHNQTAYLEDPSVNANFTKPVPSVRRVIWIGLSSQAILGRFRSPEEWERLIAVASVDPLEGVEIESGAGSLTSFNCALCGGGLGATACLRCKAIIRDTLYGAVRVAWHTPLPPKLLDLLKKAGHEFQVKAA